MISIYAKGVFLRKLDECLSIISPVAVKLSDNVADDSHGKL